MRGASAIRLPPPPELTRSQTRLVALSLSWCSQLERHTTAWSPTPSRVASRVNAVYNQSSGAAGANIDGRYRHPMGGRQCPRADNVGAAEVSERRGLAAWTFARAP